MDLTSRGLRPTGRVFLKRQISCANVSGTGFNLLKYQRDSAWVLSLFDLSYYQILERIEKICLIAGSSLLVAVPSCYFIIIKSKKIKIDLKK